MKTNCWLILGAMLATSAIAQDNTNALPEMPAPVSSPAAETAPATAAAPAPAPAPKPAAPVKHARRAVHRRPLHEPTVNLVPGPAQVTASDLLVRGQAGFRGVAVAHLSRGATVTVLDQINLEKHTVGEPAQWAKIACPTNLNVWVSARYVDAANNTVTARKLNLRAGPGENYGVLGTIERGASVDEIARKGGWLKIEPPAGAYAFVAAMYLKQEAPAPVVTTAPAETETAPTPTPTPVPQTQPVVTEPSTPPAAETAPAAPAPEAAAPEENVASGPRVTAHEGVVRHVGSPIAPTAYELYDPTTDENIDFLYTTTTNLQFSRYVGMRIIATGEEGLAQRWNNIPVMTVEKIQVINPHAVTQRIYRSPRQSQPY